MVSWGARQRTRRASGNASPPIIIFLLPSGKAVWKLDDPAALRAEQEERVRQVAEQACKKLQTQLLLKVSLLSDMCANQREPSGANPVNCYVGHGTGLRSLPI